MLHIPHAVTDIDYAPISCGDLKGRRETRIMLKSV